MQRRRGPRPTPSLAVNFAAVADGEQMDFVSGRVESVDDPVTRWDRTLSGEGVEALELEVRGGR